MLKFQCSYLRYYVKNYYQPIILLFHRNRYSNDRCFSSYQFKKYI